MPDILTTSFAIAAPESKNLSHARWIAELKRIANKQLAGQVGLNGAVVEAIDTGVVEVQRHAKDRAFILFR